MNDKKNDKKGNIQNKTNNYILNKNNGQNILYSLNKEEVKKTAIK